MKKKMFYISIYSIHSNQSISMARNILGISLTISIIKLCPHRRKDLCNLDPFAYTHAWHKVSDIPIIFGGANCEGEMGSGLLEIASCVDYVCSGEGDIAFIEFLKYFMKGEPIPKINGIITRKSNFFEAALTSPIMNMDDLPYPDFDDYFACKNSSIEKVLNSSLVIETSRGCWWGEKSQCTFCGLNGSTMRYRSKSISRALNEMEYLIARYGKKRFQVVDNIMDLKYLEGLFPKIYEKKLGVDLFYETKANLSKKQLALMKQGGVTEIQPGIESLSDIVLKIMKKGISALQNIQLLKWCSELGIVAYWNILLGFPNEPEEEYENMTRILPLLFHLHPPTGVGKIVMDRFSPYFIEPLQNGLINVRPAVAYNYVYPVNEILLNKIAYHFEFDYADGRNPISYANKLKECVYNWVKLWRSEQRSVLHMKDTGNIIMIQDTRPCAIQSFHIVCNEDAEVYRICESTHSFDSLMIKVKDHFPMITEEPIKESLHNLIDNKLMLEDKENFLSLAIKI